MNLLKNIALTMAVVAAVFVPVSPVSAAGNASLTVNSAGSAVNGSTIGVSIYENGDAVNVVTAKLIYDAASLQFIGVNASGSAFGSDASTSGGNGSAEVSRFVPGGATVSGNQFVATVNFKVLAGTGTTRVSTVAGSQVVSNGADIWNGVSSSSSVVLSAPAPTAPRQIVAPVTTMTPVVNDDIATPAVEQTPVDQAASTQVKNDNKSNPRQQSNVEVANASSVGNVAFPTLFGLLVIVLGAAAIILMRRRRAAVSTEA